MGDQPVLKDHILFRHRFFFSAFIPICACFERPPDLKDQFCLEPRVVAQSRLHCIYSCFLDASKAFDKVNHSVLFSKLLKRKVPLYIVRILCFWYRNQDMVVRWENHYSSSFKVSNGVRQGSILSPYLFCLYCDDLSAKLNGLPIGCVIGNAKINHLLYADDLVLLCPSAKGLQKLIHHCEQYGIEHDITYNSTKSAIMIFKCDLLKNYTSKEFYLNEELIPIRSSYKYLGHILQDDLRDDLDIDRQRKKLYAQGNSIFRKFYMCSEETKVLLFKMFCSPLYTSQLWCNYSVSSLKKLNVAYNNTFRLICNEPKRSLYIALLSNLIFTIHRELIH